MSLARICQTCAHCTEFVFAGRDHLGCLRPHHYRNGGVLRPPEGGFSTAFEVDSIPEPQRVDADKCGPERRHWVSRT